MFRKKEKVGVLGSQLTAGKEEMWMWHFWGMEKEIVPSIKVLDSLLKTIQLFIFVFLKQNRTRRKKLKV